MLRLFHPKNSLEFFGARVQNDNMTATPRRFAPPLWPEGNCHPPHQLRWSPLHGRGIIICHTERMRSIYPPIIPPQSGPAKLQNFVGDAWGGWSASALPKIPPLWGGWSASADGGGAPFFVLILFTPRSTCGGPLPPWGRIVVWCCGGPLPPWRGIT